MLHKKGIVRKTFLFSSLLILLVVLLSFVILYFTMPQYYSHKKKQTLQNNLDSLTQAMQEVNTHEECAQLIATFVAENNANVAAFDINNRYLPELSSPLVSMPLNLDDRYYLIVQAEDVISEPDSYPNNEVYYNVTIEDDGSGPQMKTQVTYLTNTVYLEGDVGSDFVDRITVTGTLQPIDEAKGVMLELIPYALFSGMLMGLLLAWGYARRISKPILQISQAAVRMQALAPDARSGVESNDELGLLSHHLDKLYASLRTNIFSLQQEMDKVSRLEQAKTEMMQSASHELKTPIAALNGMLEGMIDNIGVYKDKEKYLRECKAQVDKLSLLVVEILSASKTDDSMLVIERVPTNVTTLVEQSIVAVALLVEEKRLRLTKELYSLTIQTDPSLLHRAIANLVSNAVRHSPVDGEIHIHLDNYGLTIENPCSDISEDELPKLFEPFYTRIYHREKNESSSGLGLYIVKRCLEKLRIPYTATSGDGVLTITLHWPSQIHDELI